MRAPTCLLLMWLLASASSPHTRRARACVDLLNHRLLEDELDIEDLLQRTSLPRDKVFDRLVTSLLIYCLTDVQETLISAVLERRGKLFLSASEEEFMRKNLSAFTSTDELTITDEERTQYAEIIAAAKQYTGESEQGGSQCALLLFAVVLLICAVFLALRRTPSSLWRLAAPYLHPEVISRKQL